MQIELHRGAAILDAEAAKAVYPATQPFAERHVRIHLPHDIATHDRSGDSTGRPLAPHARPQISEHCAAFACAVRAEEVVEDREQLLRRHPVACLRTL